MKFLESLDKSDYYAGLIIFVCIFLVSSFILELGVQLHSFIDLETVPWWNVYAVNYRVALFLTVQPFGWLVILGFSLLASVFVVYSVKRSQLR